MTLSILIPVYNEEKTVGKVLKTLLDLDLGKWRKEIILINDCSTDRTLLLAKKFNIQIFSHNHNLGKGTAIRTGLTKARGELVIIQDADMEYNPMDIRSLLTVYENNPGCVIFGTRFRGRHEDTVFGHKFGNFLLTVLTNIFYGSELSDMETCYKLIPRNYLNKLDLKCHHFDFEPEITAKLLKKGIKILEVPISYQKRGFSEGKKLKWWRDGLYAAWTLIKYRLIDD